MRRRKPGFVAVALCLGGALTACGGGSDDGYAAVGAGQTPKGAVAPSGAVTLAPLDGPTPPGLTSSTSSPSPAPQRGPGDPSAPPSAPGPGPVTVSPGPEGRTTPVATPPPGTAPGQRPAPPAPTRPATDGPTPPPGSATPPLPPAPTPPGPRPPSGSPSPPRADPPPNPRPAPTPTPAPGPAVLTVSAPALADTDRRWCERVTVTFRNTGGSPAASGTVTFATQVIGALGIDWGTVTTAQPLPAPIAAGAARTETYTVCVDSWRVPLGTRVDTRKVTATWR